MKTNIKKDNKRSLIPFLTFFLSAVVVAALVLLILEKMKVTDFIKLPGNVTEAQQQETAKKYDAQKKQDFIEDKSPQQTTPTTPQDTNTAITLNASQDSTSVTVLSKLSISSGTCNLVIKNGDKTFQDSAPIIYQPEFSSCAGFSVATSKLGVGSWDISITAVPESGESLTKTITLDVK